MSLSVAIQGVPGCFHDAAAHEFLSPSATEMQVVENETFTDLFAGVRSSAADLGIVAIENTIAGSRLDNDELLRNSGLRVIGEHKKRISHVLCALPGQSLDDITEVNSHHMALRQCEEWLRRHPRLKRVEYFDTAGAARDIARRGLTAHAAVCGDYCAELYGLNILANGIETNKHNYTRFLVVALPGMAEKLRLLNGMPNKASVMFTLPHRQGALSRVLAILSFYDINLSKIQSTPIIGREWEYRFYADFTFDSAERYHQALDAARPLMNDFILMGEYTDSPTPEI